MEMMMHEAVATSNDTWVPPPNASPPNKLMVSDIMPISTTMGRMEMSGCGVFWGVKCEKPSMRDSGVDCLFMVDDIDRPPIHSPKKERMKRGS